MPIVNGVDLPDFQMISVLCANKMIKKSKEKGNTWRDLKYVRHDEFLYEALLDHANRITIPDRLVDWNHTGAYEFWRHDYRERHRRTWQPLREIHSRSYMKNIGRVENCKGCGQPAECRRTNEGFFCSICYFANNIRDQSIRR